MNKEKITEYVGQIIEWGVFMLPKIILAIIIIYVGLFIARKLSKMIGASISKANLDEEVQGFLISIVDFILKATVFLIAASVIGIKLTALLGLLAAAGFAVGMALQGFLGNFAAGLTILFLKPYRVGDWVEITEKFGRVKSIQIFNTTLETPNYKTLIIPNGQVTDNIITNYSTLGNIRLELNVSMPYAESFPRVKEIIMGVLNKSKYVQDVEKSYIGIDTYDSHNITIAIRPYIKPDDYWEATYEIYEMVKKAFSENGVQAAYSEGVELGPIGQ